MVSVAQAPAPARPLTRPLRVAIVADLREERWHSMDLVADMLMAHAGGRDDGHECLVEPVLMRPAFAAPLPAVLRASDGGLPTAGRIFQRFWSYPRWLAAQPPADVYHVVDHSYAHLVAAIPGGRAVVTCHDVDAFRTLVVPGDRESALPRRLAKRILTGLQRAAAVVCVSDATRAELSAYRLVPEERLSVVANGVHPSCSPVPDAAADAAAAALTGAPGRADLLHVGSTIPRKRIDLLLAVLAATARDRPDVRLWRVGGPFTAAQASRARELGVEGRITVLPHVDRAVLAALYRRASLVLLTSEREGFGLPVIEAMACGTPVVCSDLAVMREVGGAAADYCALDSVDDWSRRIVGLLAERDHGGPRWAARRASALARAGMFTWAAHGAAMRRIYARVAANMEPA